MSQSRKFQITCKCNAYKFPHRLGGGTCDGSHWTEAYYSSSNLLCAMCKCNVDGQCQVASGQESIEHCEAVINAYHTHIIPTVHHSTDDFDAFMRQQHAEYYGEWD